MISFSEKKSKNWFIDVETYSQFPKLMALSIPDMTFFMIMETNNASQTLSKRTKSLIRSAARKGTISLIEENESWKEIILLLNKGERVFLSKSYYKKYYAHFEFLKTTSWDTIKNICDEIELSPNQALYFLEKSLAEKQLNEEVYVLDKIKSLTKQIQLFKENTENMNWLLNRLIIIKNKDIQFLIRNFKWSLFQYNTLQAKVIRYQLLKKLRFFS